MQGFALIATIHIVDDDSTVRAAISYLLTSHGYATQIYSSGVELLRERALRPGCILLDLRMDEKSGLEVLEELERRGSRLPVIAMSGNDDVGAIVQSMKLGAVDFIKKPYDPRELLVTIERVRGSAQRREHERGARIEAEARLKALSPRELQILRGLIAGMTNKEIARRRDPLHRCSLARAGRRRGSHPVSARRVGAHGKSKATHEAGRLVPRCSLPCAPCRSASERSQRTSPGR